MEEDSLLAQALKHNSNQNNNHNHGDTLVVDVFLLPTTNLQDTKNDSSAIRQRMLALADVGVQINYFLQKRYREDSYPWMQGGDGPVFGIHASPAVASGKGSDDDDGNCEQSVLIPRLRAECRYGVSVADEWYMVGLVMEMSQKLSSKNIVVEFTDLGDGQILLIQAAEFLPACVDHIGPMNCVHRCWVKNGMVHLIAPRGSIGQRQQEQNLALSLSHALDFLYQSASNVAAHPDITRCIEKTVEKVRRGPSLHRATILLPRSVARLIHKRPDLTSVFCESFARHIHDPLPKEKFDMAVEEEWVWLTHEIGRTSYAMLRSLVSPPDWKTETSVPMRFQSPQVKRLQRQCLNQATPHLRHALQVGVRTVAGMDAILRSKDNQAPNSHSTEARITNLWPMFENSCGGDGSWMIQAWNDGPNRAQYDLSKMMKCPVFQLEVEGAVTPLLKADTSLVDQIRQGLKENTSQEEDAFPTSIPSADDVDKEDWMLLPTDQEMEDIASLPRAKDSMPASKEATQSVDSGFESMLEGFQDFVKEKSTYEGVSNDTAGSKENAQAQDQSNEIDLNPRVFLNLLRATLQAQSGEEVAEMLRQKSDGDDYFAPEDYDMGDEEDSDDGLSPEGDPLSMELMGAMDRELATKTNSRSKDTPAGDEEGFPVAPDDDDIVADDIHLLTNLIRSLEAGGGAPGPVNTMLSGMGKDTPRIPPIDDLDES